MHALLFLCRDGARFHLGRTSLDDTSELLHADTLFSALAHLYEQAYGDAQGFIEHVRRGRLRFSSGLLAVVLSWKEDPVLFLPCPPVRFARHADDPSLARRLKQIRYVSRGLLAEISAAVQPADDPDRPPVSDFNLLSSPRLGRAYACTVQELGDDAGRAGLLQDVAFAHEISLPHVAVHKVGREDAFYHITSLLFSTVRLPGGATVHGHFCMLVEHDLEDEQWRRFLTCARLLADEGIGGERSCGLGQFEGVRLLAVPELAGQRAPWSLALAPVIPADEDEFQRALHYELFPRGGGSLGEQGDPGLHRKRVRMMREGALFRGMVRGRIADVSPGKNPFDHAILRNGRTLALPFGPPS